MAEDVFVLADRLDLKSLSQLKSQDLSETNEEGQTILHIIAQTHNTDLLFVCICLECDTSIEDDLGRLYSDYLEAWEYNRIKQLYEAHKPKKLLINEYADHFDRYVPHGFSLDGQPLVCTVWEQNRSVAELEKILESGVDLDHPLIRNAEPTKEYAQTLARYGWIPRINQELVCAELNNYYIPKLWNSKKREYQFKVTPIAVTPRGLLQKTIVCISDTHWSHRQLHVPGGDILICAGDLCMPWDKDLTDYIVWMGEQTHTHKIFIAGNHDGILQKNRDKYLLSCRKHRIIYLEDSGIELYGIKFWGSPWTPIRPGNKNNAFTTLRSKLMKKWDLIPSDTEFLITHCPPYGIGDLNSEYYRGAPHQCGDFGLRKTINRLTKLKVHIFGHQHYGRGLYRGDNGVHFANCSKVNENVSYIFT